jgi:hypothetical protein
MIANDRQESRAAEFKNRRVTKFELLLKLAFAAVLFVSSGVLSANLARAQSQFSYNIVDNETIPNGHKPKVIGDFANSGFSSVGAFTVGQGFKLYQYPNWTRHVISTHNNADTAEDACVADVNGDGALDIVIGGLSGITYWLENPLMQGLDPYNSDWVAHLIDTGRQSHDVVCGDVNNDQKIDIATDSGIYIQGKTPDTWSFIGAPNINRIRQGTSLANICNCNDQFLDLVAPYADGTQLAWFENPLHRGGDLFNDTWAVHVIDAQPGFIGDMTSTEADFNQDGRLDVAMAPMYNNGRLAWYQAPLHPNLNQRWVKHVIGSANFVHQGSVQAIDFNGDGLPDLGFVEQEQSNSRRIAIYFNAASGASWTLDPLAITGGHNPKMGTIGNDALPSIFSANHGYNGFANPLELWRNQGSGGSGVPAK